MQSDVEVKARQRELKGEAKTREFDWLEASDESRGLSRGAGVFSLLSADGTDTSSSIVDA